MEEFEPPISSNEPGNRARDIVILLEIDELCIHHGVSYALVVSLRKSFQVNFSETEIDPLIGLLKKARALL